MTAVVTLKMADRIELLADGAIYTEDGVLIAVKQKIRCHSELPLAVTGRGQEGALSVVANAIMTAADVLCTTDSVIEFLPKIVATTRNEFVSKHGHFEVIIAAILESYGPRVLCFSSYDSDHLPAFSLTEMPVFGVAGPHLTADQFAEFGLTQESVKDGLGDSATAIMDAMRNQKAHNPLKPDLPAIFGIGGHVQKVTIAQSGCKSEVLKTYFDEVGQKIFPEAQT